MVFLLYRNIQGHVPLVRQGLFHLQDTKLELRNSKRSLKAFVTVKVPTVSPPFKKDPNCCSRLFNMRCDWKEPILCWFHCVWGHECHLIFTWLGERRDAAWLADRRVFVGADRRGREKNERCDVKDNRSNVPNTVCYFTESNRDQPTVGFLRRRTILLLEL